MAEERTMNALELALKNEMTERNFYLANASRTNNPLEKAMFAEIADDELEHYQRLQELHKIWSEQGKWPQTVPLKVNDTNVRTVFKKIIGGPRITSPGDVGDLKALREAIEFEGNGASFYARLRDQVTDPKEKEFFNLLANIEHEHYVSLVDAEEFMTNPESWYRRTESSGLDGA